MDDTDQTLLTAWREGDREAGTELFRRHFDRIRRFFRNKVDPLEVEDMVQRTFTALVESRDRYRGDGRFVAFLFGIARRQLHGYLRRRVRHDARQLDVGVSSVQALGLTPSAVVSAQQEHAWVQQALQRLPVHFQTMLELSYWEGIPGPELAQILGISPTTVRTRLFRAREALERELRVVAGLRPNEALPFDVGTVARAVGDHL